MIIYDLECSMGHRFEGWFPSAKTFEEQQLKGLVQCSVCGGSEVKRIPSGGHQASRRGVEESPKAKVSRVLTRRKGDAVHNFDPILLLKSINRFIREHGKDVGDKFAERALAIQRGDAPEEPIYGTATDVEQDKMDDEDISYALVPKLTEDFDN